MTEQETLEGKILKFEGKWKGGGGSSPIGITYPTTDSGKFTMEICLKPDGTFTGTTTDKHGKARVEGTLTNDEINFTKKYISRESGSRVKGNIVYEKGKRNYDNPNEFNGKWYIEATPGKSTYSLPFKLTRVK
ncbi:hypothetical protein KY332_01495 [Candidatus Woesearchaeota archaeon]|nr:hypothetical protein [Candidatus Woesearchaeota archaeon]